MPTNPTTPEAAERARFEAWAGEKGYVTTLSVHIRYRTFVSRSTEYVWIGWQARAALSAQEGGGGDEYQSAITQDQVDRARNAFFKKMMLGFGVDDCFFAALHAAQEGGGGEHDGYKEAAIAWTVCASIHREYAKGRDPLYTTRQADYMKAHEAARTKAMRATQEGTGNG